MTGVDRAILLQSTKIIIICYGVLRNGHSIHLPMKLSRKRQNHFSRSFQFKRLSRSS